MFRVYVIGWKKWPVEEVPGGRLRRGVGVVAEDILDQDIPRRLKKWRLIVPTYNDCLADQGPGPGSEGRGPEQVKVASTNEALNEPLDSAS
ncbi:hypothetical protein CSIM01_05512 [Colletotrichum simmondsii]|uniref:Uncharacterized protein n=1 Tax=Colletotrichum simmondsii TaxID=703756 RepID=A0A135S1F8_9PEZI|nr:hypothetical protein CSIM01_05512 [Colletotrichum simmondsii]